MEISITNIKKWISMPPIDMNVLKRHYKALSHLRERKKADRLALFLGAGVSKPFRLPNWAELISKIEQAPEFDDYQPNDHVKDLNIRSQRLIQYLIKKESSLNDAIEIVSERIAKHKWLKIVHRHLYSGSNVEDESFEHPYLSNFLGVIKESPLTVNYNFDDCVERMLSKKYRQEQSDNSEKVFETVWEPSTQYQRSKGVIYHPNGFLPLKLVEGYSDQIVFTESEFADQLILSMQNHYSTLFSHLTRYTSVFIGLSLNDPTLKNLLRQNTNINSGHVHYYLKYCDELPTEEEMETEKAINFEVFGVVTLHLTGDEFAAFGKLLSTEDETYDELADRYGLHTKFTYYITGAVGAGKTTTVNKMKSLKWFGEWIESKPDELAKPHTDLTQEERQSVDKWVSDQFRKKDFKIEKVKCGLIISDRSPLDPLAFSKIDNLSSRAKEHLNIISPHASRKRLNKGHIILLSASGQELFSRTKHRHENATPDYLENQQDTIRKLYSELRITELSTSGRLVDEVVKCISKIIHLDPYHEQDIHYRLEVLANEK